MADEARHFDLAAVIDDLPAAEFFWYSLVPNDRKAEYCQLLSKLLQLFITPHVFSFYPYREASYLKKYESVFRHFFTSSNAYYAGVILSILYLETSFIDYEGHSVVLNSITGEDMMYYATTTFENAVQNWYTTPDSNPLYIVPLVIQTYELAAESHSVFLGLKKYPQMGPTEPIVKFIFFEPHGYADVEANFARLLKQKLVNALSPYGVRVVQILLACPTLQIVPHGGNCAQHTAMVFFLIMKTPELFDHLPSLLNQLARNPTLNVLLFSLSIFLRTMPYVHLYTYYYAALMTPQGAPVTEREQMRDLFDTNTMSEHVSTLFHMPNCPNVFSDGECDTTVCALCEGRCQFQSAVRQAADGCHVLTPKEIAEAMFRAYFQVKDMALEMDPQERSFLATQMEQQLSFEVPASNADYARLGLPVTPE